MSLATTVPVVDTDSHLTEPPDLWTSRLASRWKDQAPCVRWHEPTGEYRWIVGDTALSAVGLYSVAGWPEPLPSYPPTLAEADPASYDAHARLHKLDEYGVHTQLLYPNLLAFFPNVFMRLQPALALACVQAYNDFVSEFAAADPSRLIPLTVVPFWDLDASVAELERCVDKGHRGVLFSAVFEQVALPNITDEHWRPVLEAAQALQVPINFHIGFAAATTRQHEEMLMNTRQVDRTTLAEQTVLGFLSNSRAISMLTLRGVCHRYPNLKFVSVESGFGFIPFLVDSLDWQFENSGVRLDHPEWTRPSEYFRRQVYCTAWFEQLYADQVEDWQDNLMFETDFPHPTSLSPGPATAALAAKDTIEQTMGHLRPEVIRKILHDNAAALYHLS